MRTVGFSKCIFESILQYSKVFYRVGLSGFDLVLRTVGVCLIFFETRENSHT